MFSLTEKSLYVCALDLWIDSMRSRERGYVSHGHSDHAREHRVVVTTPNTAAICRSRFRLLPTFEEHAFNAPWEERDHRLTLFSAGHVLGSSQLMIEGEAGSFVYTGDFKLEPSLTVEPPEVKRCDVLLMECTFGRPHYVFPPRDEVAGEMIAFARKTLEGDAVPVFFAYSLGKAQEAMAILGGAGVSLVVHAAVDTLAKVYAACGVTLPSYKRYDADAHPAGSAIIWPPGGKMLPKTLNGKPLRTAILTGWAIDRNGFYRYRADRGFALSDHADYPALLRYVELAQPRRVLLNHGWKDFAYRLRGLGIDAQYLEHHEQLSLF